ncbi:MAG: rod shape-determining protein MreC [Deltaproteobacteria bacterium]|nr:rod shape-determining protein MreC [Deltaproteobacteria bacterium]
MPRSIRDIALIFLLIAAGFFILFSADKKAGDNLAGRALYTLLSPFQRAAFAVHHRVGSTWKAYAELIGVREENERLKQEIRGLHAQRNALLDKERENRRLRKLLDLKTQHDFYSVVAQIVGEDAVGWYRTFFINRGSEDGLKANVPVTAAEGVVGRISKLSRDMSQVLLITDPNFSVDCRVAQTRDRGVLSGSLENRCVLRYVKLDSEAKPGDEVVTSGLDGFFPRGLLLGRIESIGKDDQRLFLQAKVIPAVNFSEIEEVLVILGERGGFDIRSGLEDNR